MKIEVQHVTKYIRKSMVLQDITLHMESGKIYGLQGPNGSGKTMLMRLLCGLILPTEGTVCIDDKYLGQDISFPDSVGILIENPAFLNDYTGLENLQMLASINKKASLEQLKEVITEVGLDPEDTRKYKKYSLGMKQKLGIACALMEEPELLILDEPFNALDSASIERTKKCIWEQKERGRLIILSCHSAEDLYEMSDEIFIIENGSLKTC
ncbi:MAG: ABC transporter ATP-binding protein [Lachnospiraceae bacterium]|nr:ABC transporter ATP-binding protein [Lachnospiraceae bacterium]